MASPTIPAAISGITAISPSSIRPTASAITLPESRELGIIPGRFVGKLVVQGRIFVT